MWGTTGNNSWMPQIIPRKTLQGYSLTQGFDSYNRPTGVTKTGFKIKNAGVQPVGGYEQQILPDLIRTKVSYKIYTTTPLKTVDYNDYTLADRVEYEGYEFALVGVKVWSTGVQSHYEAMMVMLEEVVTGGDI